MQDDIIKKIQNGLKDCSEKHLIMAKDIQLLIKSNGSINIMNMNHRVVENIKIVDVFKITPMQLMLMKAKGVFSLEDYFKKTIEKLAIKRNVDPSLASARIFTKQSDFYPCVYLHSGDKIVGEITINELLN